MKPELDLWKPGEHNGTFRGNQLAFVGGSAALDYRIASNLEVNMKEKELCVKAYLENEVQPINERIGIRGIGLIWGIDLAALRNPDLAARITARCFERGLIIERAGSQGQVIKLLPALNMETSVLSEGCRLLGEALKENPDLRSGNRLKIRRRIKKNGG
jgi:diaminobutyrate-2-oxoglutarate transaminase